MMDIVPASDRSYLVRLPQASQVIALADALEQQRPQGVTSFSPAYASVLVRYDPAVVSASEVEEWLRSWQPAEGRTASVRRVDLPAMFDGPDLQSIAEARRLPAEDVVSIFCSTEYRVHFLGFVPGFAYMGDVDPRITMRRRDVPRKSVPAGSVGIAGRQTAVYPAETPGGWNLIGRCTQDVFDPERDPACLLLPGDVVRFVRL